MKDFTQDMAADRLMSISEVCVRLHVNRRIVTRILNAGLLPFIKINKTKRISVFAFNRFIEKYSGSGNDFMSDVRQVEEGNLYVARRQVG